MAGYTGWERRDAVEPWLVGFGPDAEVFGLRRHVQLQTLTATIGLSSFLPPTKLSALLNGNAYILV